MHSPRPVSAESTLRGRTARALYHIPAGMCQKTPIRTDREGERTRIRTGGTINTSMPQHRNAKPAPSPAEQVRLPLQWCVYFRALRVDSLARNFGLNAYLLFPPPVPDQLTTSQCPALSEPLRTRNPFFLRPVKSRSACLVEIE